MATAILIGLCLTLGAGVAAQWVAWRFKLPAIVILFCLGLAFGPGLGVLHPSESLGWLFRPLVSSLVAIIVFEGGLLLDFRQLQKAGDGVKRLIFLALPLSWGLGWAAAYEVGKMDWEVAALFGAIITVTGPTVVLPLLRLNKLSTRVAAFLRWEAIINDPIGAILAAVVLQIVVAPVPIGTQGFLRLTLPDLLASSALSVAAGILPAYGVRALFVRDLMPETLKTPLLLTLALLIFALCTTFMEGAGLIGATVFGMALTNLHVPGMAQLRRVKEALVSLVVAVLFILMTADLQRDVLTRLSFSIVALMLTVLFVVRPVAILLSTIRSDLTWQERLFVAWIAPRGIVAAAVAGAAGLRIADSGYSSADVIMPAIFAIIGGTMIFHGFSLRPLARVLGLTLSNEPVLMLVGASPWVSNLAATVHRERLPVLLVDYRSTALMPAARNGVPTLRAEVLSPFGQEALEERPGDYLIAATPDAIYNGLICAHLSPDMGRQRVFQISPGVSRMDFHHGLSRDARGRLMGEPSWNYSLFETLYKKNWRFRCFAVDEALLPSIGVNTERLDLFYVKKGVSITIYSTEDGPKLKPGTGDLLFSFVPQNLSRAEEIADPPPTSEELPEERGARNERASF